MGGEIALRETMSVSWKTTASKKTAVCEMIAVLEKVPAGEKTVVSEISLALLVVGGRDMYL